MSRTTIKKALEALETAAKNTVNKAPFMTFITPEKEGCTVLEKYKRATGVTECKQHIECLSDYEPKGGIVFIEDVKD